MYVYVNGYVCVNGYADDRCTGWRRRRLRGAPRNGMYIYMNVDVYMYACASCSFGYVCMLTMVAQPGAGDGGDAAVIYAVLHIYIQIFRHMQMQL
jgi:hypothetical protein